MPLQQLVCLRRYRIYIEGRGWSVSEKYILACESVALMVRPRFHDFFSRGLSPLRHYWPVRGDRGMCRSIKHAVDWGNAHADRVPTYIPRSTSSSCALRIPNTTERSCLVLSGHGWQAQEMAGNASRFIREELTMDRVYDYMFHLLTEYARLLRYRPAVPRGAAEVTVESMIRGRRGLERQFMVDTLAASASGDGPCRLKPAYSPEELQALRRARADAVRQVEAWEI
jgi:hypothetical protein